MTGNRLVGVALLVLGLALLFFGYNASETLGEQVTEGVTGKFTDETMWYLIGGAVSAIVGLVLLVRR